VGFLPFPIPFPYHEDQSVRLRIPGLPFGVVVTDTRKLVPPPHTVGYGVLRPLSLLLKTDVILHFPSSPPHPPRHVGSSLPRPSVDHPAQSAQSEDGKLHPPKVPGQVCCFPTAVTSTFFLLTGNFSPIPTNSPMKTVRRPPLSFRLECRRFSIVFVLISPASARYIVRTPDFYLLFSSIG